MNTLQLAYVLVRLIGASLLAVGMIRVAQNLVGALMILAEGMAPPSMGGPSFATVLIWPMLSDAAYIAAGTIFVLRAPNLARWAAHAAPTGTIRTSDSTKHAN